MILKKRAVGRPIGIVALVAALLVPAAVTSGASAQPYPSKPIRLITPFPAGGAVDIVGRLVGQRIEEALGQSVVMDNRPGASGIIGATLAARAAPDGYTLLAGSGGPLAVNIQIVEKPPYDPIKDFAPITMVAFNDGILVVNPSFPAKTLKEFVEVLKSSPGKYAYASSGPGGMGYLSAELLKSVTGSNMLHVPYKGVPPAVVDVIAGRVPILPTNLTAVEQHIRSGRLRAIAAMGAARFPTLPDLATVAESGYPGFSASSWMALLAPAGTPSSIVRKLNDVWRRAIADRDFNQKLVQLGSRPTASSPDELRAYMREELTKWRKFVRAIHTSSVRTNSYTTVASTNFSSGVESS